MAQEVISATGRRKTAVARVRMTTSGEGNITVNERTLEDMFPRDTLRMAIHYPLALTEKLKSVEITALVNGGGVSAQADALAHGISRCLIQWDPALRGVLKKEGMLTRDPRMKERKKYGQHGARKRTQFSKR